MGLALAQPQKCSAVRLPSSTAKLGSVGGGRGGLVSDVVIGAIAHQDVQRAGGVQSRGRNPASSGVGEAGREVRVAKAAGPLPSTGASEKAGKPAHKSTAPLTHLVWHRVSVDDLQASNREMICMAQGSIWDVSGGNRKLLKDFNQGGRMICVPGSTCGSTE